MLDADGGVMTCLDISISRVLDVLCVLRLVVGALAFGVALLDIVFCVGAGVDGMKNVCGLNSVWA